MITAVMLIPGIAFAGTVSDIIKHSKDRAIPTYIEQSKAPVVHVPQKVTQKALQPVSQKAPDGVSVMRRITDKNASKKDLHIRDMIISKSFASTPRKISDNGLYAVKFKDGSMALISGDTKIVIDDFHVFNTVNGRALTKDELLTGNLIKWSDYGVSPKILTGEVLGTGKRQIIVFVDPLCPNCHKFLNDIINNGVPSGYSFKVVPVNAISLNEGQQVADEVLSKKSLKGIVKLMASRKEPVDYMNDKNNPVGIQAEKLNRAVFLATRSKRVPLFVTPEGKAQQGYGDFKSLKVWMK